MSLFDDIDASAFKENAQYYYEMEFLLILSKIVLCYKKIISNGERLENNEDKIRDYIHCNYLNNQAVCNELNLSYHFECEPKEYGSSEGYLDIKIFNENIFSNPSEYYIIECKRLNNQTKRGRTGLNGKYIEDGILRFVRKKYSSFHRINGMIGFVVEKMDIDSNVSDINYLLSNIYSEANATTPITPIGFIEDFRFQYFSEHKDTDESYFKLYHLMLDFSDSIKI